MKPLTQIPGRGLVCRHAGLLFLALAGAVLGLTEAWAVIERAAVYTRPLPPPPEVLDRLNLQMAWQLYVPMDGTRDGLFSIQLWHHDLYVQTRSGLVMLVDPETGAVRWRSRFGVPYRAGQPLAFNSQAVFALNGNFLYGLDHNTGDVLFRFRLRGGITAPPVADEDFLYIASPDGGLTTYYIPRRNVLVGRPREVTGPTPALRPGADTGPSGTSGPPIVSVMGENRRTTAAVGPLVDVLESALEEEVGPQPTRVWRDLTSLRIELPPLFTRESLVIPASEGTVIAFARLPREDGVPVEKYRFPLDGELRMAAGQFEEMVYLGAQDANLYALEVPNGKLVWRHTAGTPITRKPAVTEEDIYVVSARAGMTRLNRATGEPMWRIPRQGRIEENYPDADRLIAVNPKYVYAADRSGRLLILDRRRGVPLSHYDTHDFVFPVSNDVTDRLYLAANNGLIVCLHDREYQAPIRHRRLEEDAVNPTKRLLAQPITDPGTPPMALHELLDRYRDKYGLNYRIAVRAYAMNMLESPEERPVQGPKAENRPLGDVLQEVLNKVNSTFQVIGDTVVIGPGAPPPPAAP
jgi:outer membrane protein assembly factor BamB